MSACTPCAQPSPQLIGIGGGNALAGKLGGALPIPCIRHRNRQAATPKPQCAPLSECGWLAGFLTLIDQLAQDIAAHDAQIAHTLGNQAGDVVIAHQQKIHRQ